MYSANGCIDSMSDKHVAAQLFFLFSYNQPRDTFAQLLYGLAKDRDIFFQKRGRRKFHKLSESNHLIFNFSSPPLYRTDFSHPQFNDAWRRDIRKQHSFKAYQIVSVVFVFTSYLLEILFLFLESNQESPLHLTI